ncbi:MAG: diguanylate cyclase [Chloroflexi bacterium]|nr:diguanylate cyclase [Chloroflexota bacterium]
MATMRMSVFRPPFLRPRNGPRELTTTDHALQHVLGARPIWTRLLLVGFAFLTVAVTVLTSPDVAIQYWYLYYAPVLIAAFSFGLRGALIGSMVAVALGVAFVQLSAYYWGIDSAYSRQIANIALVSTLERLTSGTTDAASSLRDAATRVLAQITQTQAAGVDTPLPDFSFPNVRAPLDLAAEISRASLGTLMVILGAIGTGYLVDQNRQKEIRLMLQASTDGLTGLLNRRTLVERLSVEAERARRYGQRFGLIMVDIDHFKRLNDTYGHQSGDDALRLVASTLASKVRGIDAVGRYGGEEFAILLIQTPTAGAQLVAERLRVAIEDLEFYARNGERVQLTASLGVAICPDIASTAEELIARADAALYESKRSGRNRLTMAGEIKSHDLKPESAEGTVAVHQNPGAALVAALEDKDHYSRGHNLRVIDYAARLGQALDLDSESLDTLKAAALLHDIGKLAVPENVLRKTSRLDPDEWAQAQEHVTQGSKVAALLPRLDEIALAVLHHHERYDGRGYPVGLRGDAIPLFARILHIADAYAAMTSDRPYRPALSRSAAIEELRRTSGSYFDPLLVESFLSILENDHALAKRPDLGTAGETLDRDNGRPAADEPDRTKSTLPTRDPAPL